MYIKNIRDVSIPTFRCGHYLAAYLIRNGISLLSQEDEIFCFSDTEGLRKMLEDVPLFIKLVDKINGGFKF